VFDQLLHRFFGSKPGVDAAVLVDEQRNEMIGKMQDAQKRQQKLQNMLGKKNKTSGASASANANANASSSASVAPLPIKNSSASTTASASSGLSADDDTALALVQMESGNPNEGAAGSSQVFYDDDMMANDPQQMWRVPSSRFRIDWYA
jgi:Tfp pilus assembly protein FimV